jgi:hypothetical protein
LVEDGATGLVYNADFCSEVMNYDGNYQSEQGVSASFCLHLDVIAETEERHLGRDRLVDVGCRKSFFLELLLDGGYSAVWGGASKGVTFTLLKARAGYAVDIVIDINPAKKGKYLAAIGI